MSRAFTSPPQDFVEGTGVLSRTSLSLSNMMAGNFGAAAEAMWDPDQLTPEQKRSIADRLGLVGGPLEGFVNVVANPIVLAGLAASWRLRVPSPSQLTSYLGQMTKMPEKWAWSKFVDPVPEAFRGGPIPKLLFEVERETNLTIRKYQEQWGVALQKFKEKTGRDYLNRKEEVLVAGLLDDTFNPNNELWMTTRKRVHDMLEAGVDDPAKLERYLQLLEKPIPEQQISAPLKALAQDMRGINKNIWNDILKDPKHQRSLLNAMSKYQGFKGSAPKDVIKEISEYWPRMRSMRPEEHWEYIRRGVLDDLSEGTRRNMKMSDEGLTRLTEKVPGNIAIRKNAMLPDPDDLRELGVSDEVIDMVRTLTARHTRTGTPVHYSMKFAQGFSRYLTGIAQAKAWTVPLKGQKKSMGEMVHDTIDWYRVNQRTATGQAGVRNLVDTVLPMLRGGMSEAQSNQALWWMTQKEKAISVLDSEWAKKTFKGPMKGLRQKMIDWITMDPSSTFQGVGQKVAGWYYLNTLGIPNPVPAAKNMLQPVQNAWALGVENVGPGMADATKEILNYFKMRMPKGMGGGGLTKELAIEEAMPEFAKAGLELDPIARGEVANALEASMTKVLDTGKWGRWSREAGNAMMSMFSHSEMYNRLATFHMARRKALRELPGQKWYSVRNGNKAVTVPKKGAVLDTAANEFAAEMVYKTQFGSGPLNSPMGIMNWPAPLRQFLSFPLRQTSLMLGDMKRNPGYLARAAAISGIAGGTAMEAFGADIEGALLWGGIPTLQEYGAFAPLPVPPALQQVGSLGMAIAQGDTEPVQRTLPLLFPGGVGAARAAPLLGGFDGLGRLIKKPYADYQHRTADGRIPVYTGEGTLQGYYTDLQILGRAFGIGDVQGRQEMQLAKYMIKQRDKVREMKRSYMEALYDNDATAALRTQQQFDRLYPNLGGLPIKPSDIRALHLRRHVSRLERLMETVPKEQREEMLATISVTMGANMEPFMGLSQGAMQSGGSVFKREAYRRIPRSTAEQRLGTGQMKLRDKIGRQGAKQRDKMFGNQTARDPAEFFPYPQM